MFDKWKNKSKPFNPERTDKRHNLWRMKNELSWIYYDEDNMQDLVSIYWFDVDLKNIFFPWVLKLEKEIKSLYIHHFKSTFKDINFKNVFLEQKYFRHTKENKKKVEEIIRKNQKILNLNKENKKNEITFVDEFIFKLTFGEFTTIIINNDQRILQKMAWDFKMNSKELVNILKYLTILRNSIAHNKTVLKIHDEKKEQRFSLINSLFNFKISKEEIDILSINAGGTIYILLKLLKNDTKKKAGFLLKEIKKAIKKLKFYAIDKNVYKIVMKKIFLGYEKEILKI